MPDRERVTTGSEPTEDTVSEPRRPRVFVHDDDKYVSIGFTDTNDTLLPMPEGWRDKARVREWADAVNKIAAAIEPHAMGAKASNQGFEAVAERFKPSAPGGDTGPVA